MRRRRRSFAMRCLCAHTNAHNTTLSDWAAELGGGVVFDVVGNLCAALVCAAISVDYASLDGLSIALFLYLRICVSVRLPVIVCACLCV